MGLHHGGWSEEDFRAVLGDIHRHHYRQLVGLASIWVDGAGEDTVQEAYLRVWSRWNRIEDAEKALRYLRRAVVNIALSEVRHRRVVRRLLPGVSTGTTPNGEEGRLLWTRPPCPADEEALSRMADEAIVRGVRSLSPQQGACVALRYYVGLSEKEIAEVRNISTGAVKKHTHRAMRRLGALLETNDD